MLILLLGEKEFRTMEKRRKEGIPMDEYSWGTKKCRELGISTSQTME